MSIFNFRDFSVRQSQTALKVGTDAMVFGSLVKVGGKKFILDIGAGTGVLSLMQAQKNTSAIILGIEIDENAIQDLKFNLENSPYANRMMVVHGDFQNYLFGEKFDLILSNPPFYTNLLSGANESLNLAKHVSKLTPEIIMSRVSNLLSESGSFWIIWPSENTESLFRTAEDFGLHLNTQVEVFGKPNVSKRIVAEFSFVKTEVSNSELTIRDHSGKYTSQYIALTEDFHDRKL